MKRKFLYALIGLSATLSWTSCQDDEVQKTANNNAQKSESDCLSYVYNYDNLEYGRTISIFNSRKKLSKGYFGPIDWI